MSLKYIFQIWIRNSVEEGCLIALLISFYLIVGNPHLIMDRLSMTMLILFLMFAFVFLCLLIGLILALVIRLIILIGKFNLSKRFISYSHQLLLIFAIFALMVIFTRSHLGSSRYDLFCIYLTLIFPLILLNLNIFLLSNRLKNNFQLYVLVFLIISCGIFILIAPIFSRQPQSNKGTIPQSHSCFSISEEERMRKAIFLGIDGASWDIILPLMEMGKLPVWQKLWHRSYYSYLQSIQPLRSPLIWTSMVSGKKPEKHLVQDFVVYQIPFSSGVIIKFPSILNLFQVKGIFELVPITSEIKGCKTLWQILSENGFSVGFLGWWASWPSEEVKGYIFSDRIVYSRFNPLSSGESFYHRQSFPEGLIFNIQEDIITPNKVSKEILSNFFQGELNTINLSWETMDPIFEFHLAYSATDTCGRIANNTKAKFPTNLMAVYFEGTDNVSHFFYKEMSPELFDNPINKEDIQIYGKTIPKFYQYQDEVMGRIISELDQNTLIITASDHGFTASRPGAYEHFIFEKYPSHSGTHHPLGVIIFSHPIFDDKNLLKGVSVLDLSPTLLVYFGLPVANDMDGKIVEEIFKKIIITKRENIESYEGDAWEKTGYIQSPADEMIRKKLKGLSYLK